tara:strand:- start:20178 stop:20528 length:351 start_codon:yes stop_codon:yes gene_type:complete
MKNFCPNEEDPISDPDSVPISQLTVYTGVNGDIFFGCQWDTSPEAIQSIANIFYQLIHENLLTEILRDLKDQCVMENREQEFDMIIAHMTEIKLLKAAKTTDDNTIVVSPSDVTRM